MGIELSKMLEFAGKHSLDGFRPRKRVMTPPPKPSRQARRLNLKLERLRAAKAADVLEVEVQKARDAGELVVD